MPRVIVTTDPSQIPDHVAVLLDERVHTVHLGNDHGAAGLIERIAWAISDAEDAEQASLRVHRDGPATEGRPGARAEGDRRPRRGAPRARKDLAAVGS
jgi:hypothetical protein